jgi:hypothetical protein
MKREKKVLMSLSLMMIFLVCVSFVSAGWFSDLFKFGEDGEGDAELAAISPKDVNLEVAGAPNPPQIVFISDLSYATTSAGVPASARILVADDSSKKDFEFYVYSEGGVNALPGPGSDAVSDANALLTLKDTINAPNRERKSSDAGANAVSCVYARDAVSPAGSIAGHIGVMSRVYRCSVAMEFYDDYGSSSSSNWQVYAYVSDSFGQDEGYTPTGVSVTNGVAQPVRATYFNKLSDSKMIPNGGVLNFGTVSYGAQTTQPTTVAGTYPLSIVNTGNADVLSTTIQGEDIPGVTRPAEHVLASWFKVDPTAPCTGNALVDGTAVSTNMPLIANAPSASSDLRICLTLVEATATNQQYSTTATGGIAWTFTPTYEA